MSSFIHIIYHIMFPKTNFFNTILLRKGARHPDVIRCHFNCLSSVALCVVRYPSSECTRNATEVVRGSPNHFRRAPLPFLVGEWSFLGPVPLTTSVHVPPPPRGRGRGPAAHGASDLPLSRPISGWMIPDPTRISDYIAATLFKKLICHVFRYSNFKRFVTFR